MNSSPRRHTAIVISVDGAALRIANIEIAIGEVDSEISRHVAGETRMHGPGKAAVRMRIGEGNTGVRYVDAGIVADPILGVADATADVRRDALPAADIPVEIGQAHPGFQGRDEPVVELVAEAETRKPGAFKASIEDGEIRGVE